MDNGSVARGARMARALALRGEQIKRSRRTCAEEVETVRSEERYMTLLQTMADVMVAVESIDKRTEAIAAMLGIPSAAATPPSRLTLEAVRRLGLEEEEK